MLLLATISITTKSFSTQDLQHAPAAHAIGSERQYLSQKQQNMFQSRSRPCFKHAVRNTTRAQLKCATPILMADNDGILKAGCMSEIWHHKPQQTSCPHFPCRFNPYHDTNLPDWRATTLRASQRSNRLEKVCFQSKWSNT